MRHSIRLFFCLAVLLSSRVVRADDDDNQIKVDVVVDVTEAGKKVAQPTPAHPAYFYPVTRGYTLGQGFVPGEKAPPPTAEVQHLIAVALAQRGYRLATKQSPPSVILMFWWGYKAPVLEGATGGGAAGGSENSGLVGGGPPTPGAGEHRIEMAAQAGMLPTDVMANEAEMEEIVCGAVHDTNLTQYNPNLRLQSLNDAARVPRYYVTVSALDYAAATQQKKSVVLWTAHMSAELNGHTLEEVLPTLIATGAPLFGRDTDGARWPFQTAAIVPMGHVEVGAPYVKTDVRSLAAPKVAP